MIEMTWAFGKTLTSEVLSKSEDLADVRLKREGLARVVESMLRKQLERSEAILKEYHDVLDRLTDRLIAERSLTAADVVEAVRLADHVPRAMTG
ncbi:hypothetical protein [Rhizobium sp. Leaf383]|uniref:hypothetical protein n=1 Tax=Rhizobium sp. Leaf383 TaxID=1736357 RepID=UPI0007147532|nr:hypothetical protein [Rhizobium sp. Leaf383]KQS81670.1 hypothetical protein ASG58_22630 [Rhizobium sp. Leaf383]